MTTKAKFLPAARSAARVGPRAKPGTQAGARFIPIRQAVYSLSPLALRAVLESEAEDSEEEIAEEQLLEEDADIDDLEPDEEPRAEDEKNDAYMALLGESFSFSDRPTLVLQNIYSIAISPTLGHEYKCQFEPPSWLEGSISEDAEPFVKRLILFITTVANWFERNKQQFLGNPSAANFVLGKKNFRENAVVTQKGFLARINTQLPKDWWLEEENFSRLLDKVWLLWPECSMPLRNVFSKEHRMEWVIQGLGEINTNRLSGAISRNDLKKAKKKTHLDPNEKLGVLCDAVDLKPKDILRELKAREDESAGPAQKEGNEISPKSRK